MERTKEEGLTAPTAVGPGKLLENLVQSCHLHLLKSKCFFKALLKFHLLQAASFSEALWVVTFFFTSGATFDIYISLILHYFHKDMSLLN